MNPEDQIQLGEVLEELCACYGRPYSESLVGGYYRALKEHSVSAVRQATLAVMRDSTRKQLMPMPAEILALVPRFEQARYGTSLEEERWRRRYDVWMRGRFSDDALEVACSLNDRELEMHTLGDMDEQRYLRCQQNGCQEQIPWCSDRQDEGRMFCAEHQPVDAGGHPVRRDEKRAILEKATPSAKSFLRSIDVIARLMTDIPITPEEQAATDAETVPLRARAFEQTAEGPGVSPGMFLHEDTINAEADKDDSDIASIMTESGWTFDPEAALWRHGRRVLLDEQVQKFWEQGTLAEVVYRSPKPELPLVRVG